MRGHAVSRPDLHQLLWSRSDRFGRVEVYQKELAEEIGVTQATMSLVMKDLVETGRVKKIAAKRRNVGIYTIRDPKSYPHPFEGQTVPGVGIERCKVCGDLLQVGPHVNIP